MKNKLNCILLVDDSAPDNRYNKIVLEEIGMAFTTKTASNGLEALDIIYKELPELILLDINMPKMDGWEFMEVYKNFNSEIKAKCTVVFLTTSLNPEDMERAESIEDAKGFYTKPLTKETLIEITDRHFGYLKNEF